MADPPFADWDAPVYHRVAEPQLAWGRAVLARLEPTGRERAIDAGCGTGRLTRELALRLPRGRVIGIDRSASMLAVARQYLRGHAEGGRVALVRAPVEALPFASAVDLIVSTATFHWVRDHDRLFRSLLTALRPGGRLVAQCGGGPNLARARERATAILEAPPYVRFFSGWSAPWYYADDLETAERLHAAGFADVVTSLEQAPAAFEDAVAYREFLGAVILREHLARLPERALQDALLDEMTALAAADSPPFTLDYWRLNLSARRRAS